jgi:hypothetical protein
MHDLGSFFSFLQELVVQELLDASDFVPQGKVTIQGLLSSVCGMKQACRGG